MELSPQAVAAATFKTVKRGYDPDEVRAYLVDVSSSLESSQQQATAMEARARAAIAKLHDASQQGAPAATPVSDDTENISRTLLLAQRAADSAVADAQADAQAIRAKAENEAVSVTAAARAEAAVALEQAQAAAARLLDEATEEVRRAKSEEHVRAEAEFVALVARRDVLMSDVDRLEQHVASERARILGASAALNELAERVPAGLGAVPRPDVDALRVSASAASGASAPEMVAPESPPQSLITGQVPLTPGLEPLVSPRPTSDDEVRTMWQEAERADRLAGDADSPTPPSGIRFDDDLG
ncbi:MAG: hypothetical protein RLZZ623_3495 [Actinomycetota bacterium]|jgi:DivIVA domain-containing protein